MDDLQRVTALGAKELSNLSRKVAWGGCGAEQTDGVDIFDA